eukprot:Rmarinus@m.24809
MQFQMESSVGRLEVKPLQDVSKFDIKPQITRLYDLDSILVEEYVRGEVMTRLSYLDESRARALRPYYKQSAKPLIAPVSAFVRGKRVAKQTAKSKKIDREVIQSKSLRYHRNPMRMSFAEMDLHRGEHRKRVQATLMDSGCPTYEPLALDAEKDEDGILCALALSPRFGQRAMRRKQALGLSARRAGEYDAEWKHKVRGPRICDKLRSRTGARILQDLERGRVIGGGGEDRVASADVRIGSSCGTGYHSDDSDVYWVDGGGGPESPDSSEDDPAPTHYERDVEVKGHIFHPGEREREEGLVGKGSRVQSPSDAAHTPRTTLPPIAIDFSRQGQSLRKAAKHVHNLERDIEHQLHQQLLLEKENRLWREKMKLSGP